MTLVHSRASINEDSVSPSRYLEFLPAIYRDDPFIGRYLRIFEEILTPIESTIHFLPCFFNPLLTPEGFLPWLSTWLDLSDDSVIPLERRRELLRRAMWLYRWRGTRRGLEEHIEICTGFRPIIEEAATTTGRGKALGPMISVKVETGDDALIRRIIESQKPAHVSYELRVGPDEAADGESGLEVGSEQVADESADVPEEQAGE